MSNETFYNKEKLDPNSDVLKNHDPLLCRIYNGKKDKWGAPYVLCRRHIEETKAHLAKNAPHCELHIIALMPINPNCNNCIGDTVMDISESGGSLTVLNEASREAISFKGE